MEITLLPTHPFLSFVGDENRLENLQDGIEEKEGSVEDFDSEQEYGERYEYDEEGDCN